MATTEDDLKKFTLFAQQQMQSDTELKLPELFDLWMLQHSHEDDQAENVAAVNASISDFLSGERGTPAGQHSDQLRQEFELE